MVVLNKSGDFIKFTHDDEPMQYVTKLIGWSEDIQIPPTGMIKREFRWAVSNRVRSAWVELTNENLQKVVLNPDYLLFVDFRITLLNDVTITINDISINVEKSLDALDPYYNYRPQMKVSERGNISSLTKIDNFTFKPYIVNPLIVLYKDLCYTTNQMFGHEVQFARAVPTENGKDFVLHEWTLYDVDEPKCVKVLVPNNEFPDNKWSYNPMGLDFEMPFEVHIVKEYFEDIFGNGIGPQKRDIIYFPLTNRIYEIESSYLWKDIMQQSVYWKVNLKKYQPKSNRYEPQSLREQFDVITRDSEDSFGEVNKADELDVTKPMHYKPELGSREFDPIRKTIDDNLSIIEFKLMNYTNTLSETQYNMQSLFKSNQQVDVIEYNALVEFNELQDRTFQCWFKELKSIGSYKDNIKGSLVLNYLQSSDEYHLTFNITASRMYKLGDILKINRHNGFCVYGEIINISPTSSSTMFTIKIKSEIIKYVNAYYQNWSSGFTNTGYMVEQTNEQILINGYSNNKGWKLSIYASRYLILKDSTNEYISIFNKSLVDDYWYGIFVNISNFYKQLTVDVWVRQWNETMLQTSQTTDLENVFSQVVDIEASDRSNEGVNYKMNAGNFMISNIRLYDHNETDIKKQSHILNETIVQDTQYALIIDNALQRLKLPWRGVSN